MVRLRSIALRQVRDMAAGATRRCTAIGRKHQKLGSLVAVGGTARINVGRGLSG
jgi:hypothetical protein